MRIDILTLFPEMFDGVLGSSILKRASETVVDQASPDDPTRARPPVVEYVLHDIRDYTQNKHGKVDQPPFGGGPGMVMQCQPVWDAVCAVQADQAELRPTRVLLTPKGRPLTQGLVETLAKCERLMLIAGHYEGFDQRLIDRLHDEPPAMEKAQATQTGTDPVCLAESEPHPDARESELSGDSPPADGLLELSIGDYVLTGGELPAMVLIDAVVRLLPGVLGDANSLEHESFSSQSGQQLDYPHYTRPRLWAQREVPAILLSGDHARIDAWRQSQRRSPD